MPSINERAWTLLNVSKCLPGAKLWLERLEGESQEVRGESGGMGSVGGWVGVRGVRWKRGLSRETKGVVTLCLTEVAN